MVIAECMSAGKVVIASRVGGIPEMINHGVNGYLMDINQPETLIDVLDDLYNNESKVKMISEKAKADAVNKYHCKSVAERTIAFYKEVSK
jgi:glycosyltransferase involved in cell wall biosynthesis